MQVKDGDELECVTLPDGEIQCVGQDDVDTIIISMQLGQMSLVPWIEITTTYGDIELHNFALCQAVALPHIIESTEKTNGSE